MELFEGRKPQVDVGTLELQQVVKGMNLKETIEYYIDIIDR
jgi:hypothetical protein